MQVPLEASVSFAEFCCVLWEVRGAVHQTECVNPSLLDEGLDKVEDAYEEDKQRGHSDAVQITDQGTPQQAQAAADGSSSNGNGSSSSRSSSVGSKVSVCTGLCTGLSSGLPSLKQLCRSLRTGSLCKSWPYLTKQATLCWTSFSSLHIGREQRRCPSGWCQAARSGDGWQGGSQCGTQCGSEDAGPARRGPRECPALLELCCGARRCTRGQQP